ncbi:Ubiquitin-conjugating enzyme E2 T [Mortierella sp. AM989]|nr:Ubiquitin-conjugating enzyme E2 T [Mortierella sp. AM989]
MATSIEKRILVRMRKELKALELSPPEGVICYPVNDNIVHLKAELTGPKDTPYAEGIFKLEINIPDNYPLEPPRCQFITRVYHPNIDDQGRICLDILKCRPKGSWGPAISIPTMLTSLIVLLGDPNPDDPLSIDIANEFKENRALFSQKAREYTKLYATGNTIEESTEQPESLNKIESSQHRILQDVEYSPASSPYTISSSTSASTAPIPALHQGSAMKKSQSRSNLKKPDLKSPKGSTATIPTSATTSSPIMNASSYPIIFKAAEVFSSGTIRRHAELESNSEAGRCSETSWEPSHVLSDNNAMMVRDASPTLIDNISATFTHIPDKKREHETTQHTAATSESIKSKKLKATKNGPSRHRTTRLDKVMSEPILDLPRCTPETLTQLASSQPAGSCTNNRPICISPTTSTLPPELREDRSIEKSSKEPFRQLSHTKDTHKPLQPINPPLEQSRYFSSENGHVTGQTSVDNTFTIEKANIGSIGKENAVENTGVDKGKGKGKGKGKEKTSKETDENDDTGTMLNSGVAKTTDKISAISTFKGYEPNTSNTSVPLSIARKRSLLKKNRS